MTTLSLDDIRARLEAIRDVAGDDEVAHGREDSLREEFIEHVRDNPADSKLAEKASLVLSTDEISFARWCA